MNRYFLEIAYKGSGYAGFQVQKNAVTIQSEVERALEIYFRKKIQLTGSSRTDAGVHALQNYFHFDFDASIDSSSLYNINAILGPCIVVKNILPVQAQSHCRFDAINREYKYYIYRHKNPFLEDRAYFYPYKLDMDLLAEAAALFLDYTDFTSFSKRRTQLKTFICQLDYSKWTQENDCVVYNIIANRFLRGMIRGMVGTMLQIGRGKITLDGLKEVIESKNAQNADFGVPAHGLFLMKVNYPDTYFE